MAGRARPATELTEVLKRADEMDQRRQAQILNQTKAIGRLQKQLEIAEGILDDHGLTGEFKEALRSAGVQ